MITFDETKRQANIVKHGIDLATLSGFFDGDLLTREDVRERRKNMSAKRGHVSVNDAPATEPDDWNSAFVTHSADELRKVVAARRTRGPNKRPTKEQVAVRYSPEVLAYFRATGAGWQTRMDEALREYVSQHKAA